MKSVILFVTFGSFVACRRGTPAVPSGGATSKDVASVDAIERIAVGSERACAVHSNGALDCWGSKRLAEDGGTSRDYVAHRIEVPGGARDIATNANRACAVTREDKVACWELQPSGCETAASCTSFETIPSLVQGLGLVLTVGVGDSHACALRKDGTVWCWGGSGDGQVGGATALEVPLPRRVDGVVSARAIVVHGNSSCALLRDGTAVCWGAGAASTSGALSLPPSEWGVPQVIRGLAGIEQLVTGRHHCALLRGGSITCWGSNHFGEAGPSATMDVTTPTRVPAPPDAVEVAVGNRHTCARSRDGSVACWGWIWTRAGRNFDAIEVSGSPAIVPGIRATAIAAGGMAACAVVGSKDVRCWGFIGFQGEGFTTPRPVAFP